MKKPETQKLTLDGPDGPLEAILSIPGQGSGFTAAVCHPHPLYGGTMNNKVVHYTARALLEMGVSVLRFNFRGVGESGGRHDNAVGEIDDCLVAVEWLRKHFPEQPVLLAGFSFGAYVAARAASRAQSHALITIAPAIQHYDFSTVDVSCPWLLIQGDKDEVVPPEQVRSWASHNRQLSNIVWVDGASHFFHGRLLDLSGIISKWVEGITHSG